MKRWILLTVLLASCGRPEPKAVKVDGRDALELPYCIDTTECFVAADKACPNGYDTVKWESSRPHTIVCN